MRPDTSSRKEGPRLTALSVVGVLRPVHLDAFSWRSRWVLPALRLNPTSGGSARVDQQTWRDSCAVAVAGDSARWYDESKRHVADPDLTEYGCDATMAETLEELVPP